MTKKKDTSPTVFVIEDDTAIAGAIRWLLSTVGLEVELFPNAEKYLEVHDPNRCGCLVVDVRMPGMSGLELLECLAHQNNPIPIIIITGHGDIPMAVRAMQAGALTFITKPFNDQHLIDEIREAIAICSGRAKAVVAKTIDIKEAQKHMESLTPRERQVLDYIVAGKLNKQIAYELAIATPTVELHRAHVMQKMAVGSLAELIKVYFILENANMLG